MNQFEQAQALELAEYIHNQERAIMSPPDRKSATHCEDCGVRIPAARRRAAAGTTRCTDCQDMAEAREKRETKWK